MFSFAAIKAFLGAISTKTLIWIFVGIVLAVGAWGGWQWAARKAADVTVAQAKQQLAETQRDLEAFKGAYNTLAAVTAEQNRAVQAMREEGEQRAKEGAAALAKARVDGEEWRRSADRMRAILAAPMPMTCDEAVQAAKDAL